MAGTALTARGIVMTVLVVVILMAGMMGAVFYYIPSNSDSPAARRQTVAICLIIAVVATIWFLWLAFNAMQDWRSGVHRSPARVGGWFHICFGGLIALGGIICSVLAYQSAVAEGARFWTFYWGMTAWGIVQLVFGVRKLRRPDLETPLDSAGLTQVATRILRRG